MQSRKWKWYIGFAVVAVLAIAASIWTYVDMVGLCINIGSVVVMAAIIIWALGYMRRKKCVGLIQLEDTTSDLRMGAKKIADLSMVTGLDVDEELRSREGETPLFENQLLRQAYAAHRRELDRLYRDGSSFRFADIAEYVNQELLDHIGNMSFCDIVGGTMTGLGILGTFLGLMIGLQDFDPSTADAMLLTIPTLIDGIKIAFLTSIFGVVYSLLFNAYCREVQEEAAEALEGFLSVYYKHVIPQPENDAFTQLIRYQQSQTDSMAQFAEEISLTMANSLKANVAPTFERIEESIAKLTDRLAKSQSETMDEVASRFVEKMDKAMGNQLTNLAENIQNLIQWQDETIGKMEQTIQAFLEAGEKVGAVNAKLDASFDVLEQYMQNMAKLQHNVNTDVTTLVTVLGNVTEKLEEQSIITMDHIEAQKSLIQSMNDASASVFERAKEYQQAAVDMQKEIAAYAAAVKDTVRTTSDAACASVEKAFGDLKNTADQIRTEITATSAAAQAEMNAATKASVSAIQETTKAASESTVSSVEKALSELKTTADQIRTEIAASSASVQAGMSSATQATISAMDKAIQAELRQMQANMGSIEKTQRAFIDGMNKSSEQLTHSATQMSSASQDLTNNLDRAMSRTYQEIDRQMAEIVRHLSGTIADIRDVTERMPKILAAAAAQTQKTTEQYLSTISESQKQLAAEVKRHNQANSPRGEK